MQAAGAERAAGTTHFRTRTLLLDVSVGALLSLILTLHKYSLCSHLVPVAGFRDAHGRALPSQGGHASGDPQRRMCRDLSMLPLLQITST